MIIFCPSRKRFQEIERREVVVSISFLIRKLNKATGLQEGCIALYQKLSLTHTPTHSYQQSKERYFEDHNLQNPSGTMFWGILEVVVQAGNFPRLLPSGVNYAMGPGKAALLEDYNLQCNNVMELLWRCWSSWYNLTAVWLERIPLCCPFLEWMLMQGAVPGGEGGAFSLAIGACCLFFSM